MIPGETLVNRLAEPALDRRPRGRRDELPAPTVTDRLEAARQVRPPRDGAVHCGHCWGLGRDAALRALEADAAGG